MLERHVELLVMNYSYQAIPLPVIGILQPKQWAK